MFRICVLVLLVLHPLFPIHSPCLARVLEDGLLRNTRRAPDPNRLGFFSFRPLVGRPPCRLSGESTDMCPPCFCFFFSVSFCV